jgi:hypothetical protein
VTGDGRGRLLVLGSIAAAVLLVGAYLVAGGASYVPAKTQDPCKPRPWRNPEGLQEIAQQFTLSALDGAACELGVSRETLVRALATPQSRERFMRRYGIGNAQLAKAIRAGLLRAVDDAERAGALNPLIAGPLRTALREIPLDQAIELVKDAESIFDRARGLLGPAQGLLESLIP